MISHLLFVLFCSQKRSGRTPALTRYIMSDWQSLDARFALNLSVEAFCRLPGLIKPNATRANGAETSSSWPAVITQEVVMLFCSKMTQFTLNRQNFRKHFYWNYLGFLGFFLHKPKLLQTQTLIQFPWFSSFSSSTADLFLIIVDLIRKINMEKKVHTLSV